MRTLSGERKKAKSSSRDLSSTPEKKSGGEYVEDVFDETRPLDIATDICAFCKEGHDFGRLLRRLVTSSSSFAETFDDHEDEDMKSSDEVPFADVDGVWVSKFSLNRGKGRTFAHFTCAIASPRVWFTGSKWLNVRSELTRANGLSCTSCGKRGASIGCHETTCKVTLHLHCALKQGFRLRRYHARFVCPEHARIAREKDIKGDSAVKGDISKGQEALPVTFENALDEAQPLDNKVYTSQPLDSDSFITNSRSVHILPCCRCEDLCDDVNDCSCIASGRNYNDRGELIPYGDYDQHRVVECNIRCACSVRRCTNRVVQRGLGSRLQIFRLRLSPSSGAQKSLSSCGWGVRTLSDIAINAFVCEFTGQYVVLDEAAQEGVQLPQGVMAARTWLPFHRTYSLDRARKDLSAFCDGKLCVDSRCFGSVASFIRLTPTGTKPNIFKTMVFDRSTPSAVPRLALFAAREISAGSELFL